MQIKPEIISFFQMDICRVVLLSLSACFQQGRRRPTPRFCAASAGGVAAVEQRAIRRKAMASDSNSPKVHRREGQLATAQIKPVIFPLFRCTSTELIFLAERLPLAGPQEARVEVLCRRHRRRNNGRNMRQRLREGKANGPNSPKVHRHEG
jgi:hypothetical protein